MTHSNRIVLQAAAILALLTLQPAAAQDNGNGTQTGEKPATPEALPSPEATPIVTPPDQPAAPAPQQPAPQQPTPPAEAPLPKPEEAQQPKPEEAQQPKPEEGQQPPKPEEGKPAANVATFVQGEVAAILGKKVVGPDEKQTMGAIVDLLVDDEGKPRAAVIDLGGFLGVGSRRVAIDWQLLKFRASKPDAPAVLNLDPADLKSAPEYKNVNAAAQVIEPSHPPSAEPAPPATAPAEPASAAESAQAPPAAPPSSSESASQPPSPQPSSPQPSSSQSSSPEAVPSQPAPAEATPPQQSPPPEPPPPATNAGQ